MTSGSKSADHRLQVPESAQVAIWLPTVTLSRNSSRDTRRLTALEMAVGSEVDSVVQWLRARGAESVAHPGGSLLEHLARVHDRLSAWGLDRDICLAGLCHATYGTDGFPASLLTTRARHILVELIGQRAESLVYLYGSCDREASYPSFRPPTSDVVIVNRFTRVHSMPAAAEVCGFCHITIANELESSSIAPIAELRSLSGFDGYLQTWRHGCPTTPCSTCDSHSDSEPRSQPIRHDAGGHTVKLAHVQQTVGPHLERNVDRALEAVRAASDVGAQLVAFPELGLTPFYPIHRPDNETRVSM